MEDITVRERDKKDFITKVLFDDSYKSFKVVYADGHIEEKEFTTVHNFNVYLHQMKEQFYRHEADFSKKMLEWIKDSIFKGLVELVLSIEAIILTSRLMDPGILKTAIIILTILFSLGYLGHKVKEIASAGLGLDYLNTVEKFIDIQEKIKIPVTDPKTGKEDNWYLASLSNVDLLTDISIYEHFATALQDDEIKQEQSEIFSKALKGE